MAQKKLNEKKISPFVVKLISLLEDPSSKGCIQWVTPQSFVIVDPNSFSKNILPKYYKHHNLSSFIRQLNIYGFSKIKCTQEGQFYGNPNFVRNSRKKLKMIQRRSHVREDTQKSISYSEEFYSNSQIRQNNYKNLQVLKSQNKNYKKRNQIIEQQIKKLNEQTKIQKQNMVNFFCTLVSGLYTDSEAKIAGFSKIQQQYKKITYILHQVQELKLDKILTNQDRVEKIISFLTNKKKQLEQDIQKDREPICMDSLKSVCNQLNNENNQQNNFPFNHSQYDNLLEFDHISNRQCFDNNQSNSFFDNMF